MSLAPKFHTMISNMKPLSLDERIRSVRRGVRATQPLQARIDLVRKKESAAAKRAPRTVQVRLDGGR